MGAMGPPKKKTTVWGGDLEREMPNTTLIADNKLHHCDINGDHRWLHWPTIGVSSPD